MKSRRYHGESENIKKVVIIIITRESMWNRGILSEKMMMFNCLTGQKRMCSQKLFLMVIFVVHFRDRCSRDTSRYQFVKTLNQKILFWEKFMVFIIQHELFYC